MRQFPTQKNTLRTFQDAQRGLHHRHPPAMLFQQACDDIATAHISPASQAEWQDPTVRASFPIVITQRSAILRGIFRLLRDDIVHSKGVKDCREHLGSKPYGEIHYLASGVCVTLIRNGASFREPLFMRTVTRSKNVGYEVGMRLYFLIVKTKSVL
ncbi:hypothetical protein DFS34DRAFT_431990 [Phlyctochytrium arcticum]|nr:hypothetical protein DFS34DRAFT_431990 [Phlyctochytrium arcticum]